MRLKTRHDFPACWIDRLLACGDDAAADALYKQIPLRDKYATVAAIHDIVHGPSELCPADVRYSKLFRRLKDSISRIPPDSKRAKVLIERMMADVTNDIEEHVQETDR